MKKPVYIASGQQRARLALFANKLAGLCDEFKVDLQASSDCIAQVQITLREDSRPQKLKTDWPEAANFEGVDSRGVYYRSISGHAVYTLDFNDYALNDEDTRQQLVEAGLLAPPKKAAKKKAGAA